MRWILSLDAMVDGFWAADAMANKCEKERDTGRGKGPVTGLIRVSNGAEVARDEMRWVDVGW